MTYLELQDFLKQIENRANKDLVVASNGKLVSKKDLDTYEDLLIFSAFLAENEWVVNKYNGLVSDTKRKITSLRKASSKNAVKKVKKAEILPNDIKDLAMQTIDENTLDANLESLLNKGTYNLRKDEIIQDINLACTYNFKGSQIIQDEKLQPFHKYRVIKRTKAQIKNDDYLKEKLKALVYAENAHEIKTEFAMINFLIANYKLLYKERSLEENKKEIFFISQKINESTLSIKQKNRLYDKLKKLIYTLENNRERGI